MKLLALDTSSGRCSAALLLGDEVIARAVMTARDHARLLLPMIDELLALGGVRLAALHGIAHGRGPGSFTGVRIAAAVTQGLAAGAALPVLGVSSLRALAAQARRELSEREGVALPGRILACMDARMGETYWAVYPDEAHDVREALTAPDLLLQAAGAGIVAGAGRGLGAYPRIADSLQLPATRVLPEAEPDAVDVARLAAADIASGVAWRDAALAQPVYLRDQVVQGAKKA